MRRPNDKVKKAMQRAKTVPLELMRFQPVLYDILVETLQTGLPPSATFTFRGQQPEKTSRISISSTTNAVKARLNLRARNEDVETKLARPSVANSPGESKLIVFMMGGATYSELRSVYEIARAQGRDLFLVTPNMLSPNKFIDELRTAVNNNSQ